MPGMEHSLNTALVSSARHLHFGNKCEQQRPHAACASLTHHHRHPFSRVWGFGACHASCRYELGSLLFHCSPQCHMHVWAGFTVTIWAESCVSLYELGSLFLWAESR